MPKKAKMEVNAFSSQMIHASERAFAITRHDTDEIDFVTREICTDFDGTVRLRTVRGVEVDLPFIAGVWVTLRVVQVYDTGTDVGGNIFGKS